MALQKKTLLQSRDIDSAIRMSAMHTKVVKMATSSGAELLIPGVPVAFNGTAWVPYTQPSDAAVYTITANSTAASAGTFDLVIDGLTIELAFDVAAAALQTAVNAVLADAGKPYTVAAVATTGTDLGDNDAVITITFTENAGAPSVDVDVSDLTGNAHALAASDAGTALSGTNVIRGFVYGEKIQLSATDEVLGVVMTAGEVWRNDINTSTIRALCAGSPSEAELDAALTGTSHDGPTPRELGFTVRGMAGVH